MPLLDRRKKLSPLPYRKEQGRRDVDQHRSVLLHLPTTATFNVRQTTDKDKNHFFVSPQYWQHLPSTELPKSLVPYKPRQLLIETAEKNNKGGNSTMQFKDQIWILRIVQSCLPALPGKCCLIALHLHACLRKDRSLQVKVCKKVFETLKENCLKTKTKNKQQIPNPLLQRWKTIPSQRLLSAQPDICQLPTFCIAHLCSQAAPFLKLALLINTCNYQLWERYCLLHVIKRKDPFTAGLQFPWHWLGRGTAAAPCRQRGRLEGGSSRTNLWVWRHPYYQGNSLGKGLSLGLLLHIALVYIHRSGALQSGQTLQPGGFSDPLSQSFITCYSFFLVFI